MAASWSQYAMAVLDNKSFYWLLPQRQRRDDDEARYEIIVTSDDFISPAVIYCGVILEYCSSDRLIQ
jgi:hypothetical protein